MKKTREVGDSTRTIQTMLLPLFEVSKQTPIHNLTRLSITLHCTPVHLPRESDRLLVAKEMSVALGLEGCRPRTDPLEPGEAFLNVESLPLADSG